MNAASRASLIAGRFIGVAFVARVAKRYPIIALAMFIVRRRRKHARQNEATTVRLRRNETLTISSRDN